MTEPVTVRVGRIGRPHGVRGELSIAPLTDEPERRFAVGATVRTLDGRPLTVRTMRWHGPRLLVTVDQVGDRTVAETLQGTVLLADVDDAAPAAADEFWDRDLVGLRVLDAAGTDVGVVTRVEHPGAQDLLVVTLATTGEQRLVPFVEALVPVVDPAAGHVQLADVGGLVDDEIDVAGDES